MHFKRKLGAKGFEFKGRILRNRFAKVRRPTSTSCASQLSSWSRYGNCGTTRLRSLLVKDSGKKTRSWNDYGAGVDVAETVVVAVGTADGDSAASGNSKGAAVGAIFGDDVGNAWDDVARRSLENGISAIRATIIGTATAATTANLAQNRVFLPTSIVCV